MVQEFSRQAGFGDHERMDITIAVDEALANVMKHAYQGGCGGPVSLTCEAENGRLEIVLRDQGQAFDPARVPERAPDEMRVGGRGTFLMHSTMDEVEYQRAGDSNLMRLRKFRKDKTP